MLTRINKLTFGLLLCLIFAACDKQGYPEKENSAKGEKIQFEIAIGKVMATVGGVQPRVVTSDHHSTFEEGDQIGVFIVKGNAGLKASGNWLDNASMTYRNNRWVFDLPSGNVYYPSDGDLLSFYAYYPYTANLPDATNFTFTINSDQRTKENYAKSHLLTASTLHVSKSKDRPVKLLFDHAVALVELRTREGGVGAGLSNKVVTTMEAVQNEVRLDLSTGEITPTDNKATITMHRVEQEGDDNYLTVYTYRAFVPKQKVLAKTELFRFSETAGSITRTLHHQSQEDDVIFEKGMIGIYTVYLQGASNTYAYQVGDYYPYKGFPILGVVFETSNGGRNGKIVDLNFITRYAPVPGNSLAPLRWGDANIDEQAAGVAGIRDLNNGYNGTRNLINKRRMQSNFADVYCIFNWIYLSKNKGNVDGMWYLPAVHEYLALRSVLNIVNPKIIALDQPAIVTFNYYRSMTEESFDKAYMVDLISGLYQSSSTKDVGTWSLLAIAMGKF